jgi:hypothetical protein
LAQVVRNTIGLHKTGTTPVVLALRIVRRFHVSRVNRKSLWDEEDSKKIAGLTQGMARQSTVRVVAETASGEAKL